MPTGWTTTRWRFVQALTRAVKSYPLVVLISRRVDEGGALSMALDEDVPRTLLDLKALTPDGAAALAVQLLGRNHRGDSIAWLHQKTRGNPLFVEQLVLDLRERGHLLATKHGAGVYRPRPRPMCRTASRRC